MKAGVVYPQIELGGDTGAVKAFAQAAEDLGYDHIVIYDHVLGAVHTGREPKLTGPYKETDPFHEPLVTYAYLAGITKTLELVTGVIILPQRQTALFAKQAADVDLFSDGRLRLGVGTRSGQAGQVPPDARQRPRTTAPGRLCGDSVPDRPRPAELPGRERLAGSRSQSGRRHSGAAFMFPPRSSTTWRRSTGLHKRKYSGPFYL